MGTGVLTSAIVPVPWYFKILSIGGGAVTIIYTLYNGKNDFDELFNGTKFWNADQEKPVMKKKVKTEYGHDYIFTIPPGLNIDHFTKIQLSMEQYLDSKVKIKYKDKTIIIKSYEFKLKDYYPFEVIPCEPMEIVIGYTREGLKKIKLKSHMLICGASGFGKSTFERGMLVCLILNNKASSLILNLVDFKRNELGLFKYSKYVNTFAVDKQGLKELLARLEKEAIRRYDEFEKERVLDIERYNKSHKRIPYVITVIDEIAQLEGDKKMMAMLQKRISFDRAAGLLYVICTQRPSVDLIPGSVKANIDTRMCYHTVDSTNSWIVLDDKEAAQYLDTPGRGLLRIMDLDEFQAMYISEDEVTELIKHTERKQV